MEQSRQKSPQLPLPTQRAAAHWLRHGRDALERLAGRRAHVTGTHKLVCVCGRGERPVVCSAYSTHVRMRRKRRSNNELPPPWYLSCSLSWLALQCSFDRTNTAKENNNKQTVQHQRQFAQLGGELVHRETENVSKRRLIDVHCAFVCAVGQGMNE